MARRGDGTCGRSEIPGACEAQRDRPCVLDHRSVRDCVPGRSFAFGIGSSDKPLSVWGYTLEPDGSGTLVTEYFDLSPQVVAPSLLDVVGLVARKGEPQGDAYHLGARKE